MRRLLDGDKTNFQTLVKAAENGDLVAITGKEEATGDDVVLLCAIYVDDDEMVQFVPLGELFSTRHFENGKSPYDLFTINKP